MRNQRYSDIRRKEQIIDIAAGILIVPMLYIFTVLVFCL